MPMLFAFPFFLAAAALAYLYAWRHNTGAESRQRTLIKTGSVAALALAALVGEGPPFLVAALALCALGDLCLSRDGRRWLLAGMAAFFFGQATYVVLFLLEGGAAFANLWEGGLQALLIAVAMGLVFWLWPKLADMGVPVVVYALAVTAMAVLAVGLPGYVLVSIGAVLFYVSDGVLAFEMFATEEASRQRLWTRPVVWGAYWVGQALITAGFLAPIV